MNLPSKPSCATCGCFSPSEPLTKVHWSRLESQLRQNQPLPDIEIQTLTKLERDIEGYDLEIFRLQSIVASLELKRDLAKKYVLRHKSLLAPIRRLSNEVLIEIFKFSSSHASVLSYQINLPQLDLSQVCSHWRSVVNASPVLWSTLMIGFHPKSSNLKELSDHALVNITSMLIAKSLNSSLVVDLAHCRNEDIHPALQLVLDQSHRCMDATLSLRASVVRRTFAVSSGFPRLQRLDIIGSRMTALPVAPRLRSLALDLEAKDFPLGRQNFPWSQLKEVELFRSTNSECTEIFSWCNQLEYTTLNGTTVGMPGSSPNNSIVSPTIISVTLKDKGFVAVEDFFRLAQIPRLQTLELDDCGFPKCFTYPFVAYSPLLTTISFQFLLAFELKHVIDLLGLLPSVTNFRWQQDWNEAKSGTVHDLFSELHPSNSRILLPRLKRFDMEIWALEEEINTTVSTSAKMVQARWVEVEHPHERLNSVRLSFPDRCFDHDLVRPLTYLSQVGMMINIQDECGFIL